jgi:hypothetical protein
MSRPFYFFETESLRVIAAGLPRKSAALRFTGAVLRLARGKLRTGDSELNLSGSIWNL